MSYTAFWVNYLFSLKQQQKQQQQQLGHFWIRSLFILCFCRADQGYISSNLYYNYQRPLMSYLSNFCAPIFLFMHALPPNSYLDNCAFASAFVLVF